MKKLLPALVFCLIAHVATSQDSTITLSRFEVFASQPGRILKTETKELGQTGAWHLYSLKATDVTTGEHVVTVLIDAGMNTVPFIADPKTIYIDAADLDSAVHALAYFLNESENLKPFGDLQFSYYTLTDIVVSCYYTAFSDTWRFRIGKVYQKLRSPVAGSFITLNRKRVTELVELLKEGNAVAW